MPQLRLDGPTTDDLDTLITEVETWTVLVTCASCGEELHIPLWQFEVTVEEEGKYAEFYCSLCSGLDEVP